MPLFFKGYHNARKTLRRFISDKRILVHCNATRYKAIKMANLLSEHVNVDFTLVSIGALLHDIGRAYTHDVTHGFVGGQILAREGYSLQVIRIVECHVLGGFTAAEAQDIGLPYRDFLPKTWEEKIVCVADKLNRDYWSDIHFPAKWVPQAKRRLDRLAHTYGGGEPFETSSQRVIQFAWSLRRILENDDRD